MKERKVIHFLNPTLFTDIFIQSFKKLPFNSEFYILTKEDIDKKYDGDNVKIVNTKTEKTLNDLISEINNSEVNAVFFHYLDSEKQKIAYRLNSKIKKIWCLWGMDLYNNIFLPYKQFEYYTQKFINKKSSFFKKIGITFLIKRMIFHLLLFLSKWNIKNRKLNILFANYGVNKYNTIKQFDLIAYIVPKEKKLLSKLFPKAKFAHLYSDPDFPFFKHFENPDENRNNILIGNSGSLTNNHLDSFEKLKNINIGNSKIIVPLSYSGNSEYIKYVIKKGKEFFGENFHPLTERLPLEEYSKLLATCKIALMNQKRQESGGNLFHLIGSEVIVFLNKDNGFYSFFKENDINVYDIKSFNQDSLHLKTDNSLYNRKKLLDLYSNTHYKKEIEKLLEIFK